MPAKQFVNVFRANAEVTRLDAELTTALNRIATLEGDKTKLTAGAVLPTDLVTAANALVGIDPEMEANAEKLATDLAAAQKNISTLEANATAAQNEIAQLKATIADPKGKIETTASHKAAAITAAQGQPAPIVTAPVTGPGTATNSMTRAAFEALAPGDKSKFMRSGGKLTD